MYTALELRWPPAESSSTTTMRCEPLPISALAFIIEPLKLPYLTPSIHNSRRTTLPLAAFPVACTFTGDVYVFPATGAQTCTPGLLGAGHAGAPLLRYRTSEAVLALLLTCTVAMSG